MSNNNNKKNAQLRCLAIYDALSLTKGSFYIFIYFLKYESNAGTWKKV